MKRITYAGGSIITGRAVTDALVNYATRVASDATSIAVQVPVLEEDGTRTVHTLLVGPRMQLDVSDVDVASSEGEDTLFPAPDLPQIGVVAASTPSPQAGKDALAFDAEVANLENGLNQDLFP